MHMYTYMNAANGQTSSDNLRDSHRFHAVFLSHVFQRDGVCNTGFKTFIYHSLLSSTGILLIPLITSYIKFRYCNYAKLCNLQP